MTPINLRSHYNIAARHRGVYFGEFYNGRRHGYGVYQWADGDLWYGCYRGGYRDGYGMLVKPDRHVYYGKWAGDTKVE